MIIDIEDIRQVGFDAAGTNRVVYRLIRVLGRRVYSVPVGFSRAQVLAYLRDAILSEESDVDAE